MEETTSATPTTTIGNAAAALALADSSSADPQTNATPDAQTTAAATVQPSGETTVADGATTGPKGEPPKWRWQDILANARETAAQETEARVRQEVEQRYTGLQDFATLAPHERAGLAVWHRALAGDPAARAQVAEATRRDPTLAATLQGMLAHETAAPVADPMPEPDLQAPDGTLVYSAKRQELRDEWNERRLLGKVAEQLKPYEQDRKSSQAREAAAAYQTTTAQVIAKMATADPEFNTHKAKVGEALAADPNLLKMAIGDGMPANPELAIELAWARVYRSTVLPAQKQSSEATVLADLQQRAVAGHVNPAAASTATPVSTLGNARAALEMASAQLGS